MSDHDLTVLVETAAQGMWNSKAGHQGGPVFADLPNPIRNSIREAALPYVFHATKALADLGYTKPRLIVTEEELDTLPNGTVVLSDVYTSNHGQPISFQRWEDGYWHRGARSGSTHPDNFLPVTVIHEVTA